MHSAVTIQRQPHALFTAVCNMRGTDDVAAVANAVCLRCVFGERLKEMRKLVPA